MHPFGHHKHPVYFEIPGTSKGCCNLWVPALKTWNAIIPAYFHAVCYGCTFGTRDHFWVSHGTSSGSSPFPSAGPTPTAHTQRYRHIPRQIHDAWVGMGITPALPGDVSPELQSWIPHIPAMEAGWRMELTGTLQGFYSHECWQITSFSSAVLGSSEGSLSSTYFQYNDV